MHIHVLYILRYLFTASSHDSRSLDRQICLYLQHICIPTQLSQFRFLAVKNNLASSSGDDGGGSADDDDDGDADADADEPGNVEGIIGA